VGRWASGAPAVLRPDADDAELADNDCRNNNFEFAEGGDEPPKRRPHPGDCKDVAEPGNDPDGARCPFAAHVRKAYPRNDTSSEPRLRKLWESTTQTHRLLRRGIPYGEASASTAHAPAPDTVDRGLLFLAYQVSIVDQFEFVTRFWANDEDFKEEGAGHDPIIGQNAGGKTRERRFRLNLPGETQPIVTEKEWVIPTGGGYFFAPSIDALAMLAGPASAEGPAADGARGRHRS
jgi:Dyp-type peroxidase family